MWKRFPEVLGLDNTYKTNRFKMYLFQVTGVTDQKSLANFGFGLINNEREGGFMWLCETLESFRIALDVKAPSVVITDKEIALKNAVAWVWPRTQQQLCVYHINAHIRARIVKHWKGPADSDDDEANGPEAADRLGDNRPDDDLLAREAVQEEAEEGILTAASELGDDYSRDGMFNAWKKVIYAPKESGFETAWASFNKSFSQSQGGIIQYISNEYMPFREQWAKCFIDRYRNYGQRVNSPVETAHKDLKSYLLKGTADLLTLHECIIQMLAKKERDYNNKAAEMEMRLRRAFLGKLWLGTLTTEISYTAVDLLAREHRRAAAAMPSHLRPNPEPLLPCRFDECTFTQQYGLPCAHYILGQLEASQPLTKDVIHARWWLRAPLVSKALICMRFRLIKTSRMTTSHCFECKIPMSSRTFAGGPGPQRTVKSTCQQVYNTKSPALTLRNLHRGSFLALVNRARGASILASDEASHEQRSTQKARSRRLRSALAALRIQATGGQAEDYAAEEGEENAQQQQRRQPQRRRLQL
jgi:hypothetical protein